MRHRLCGLTIGLLGLACLGYGPYLLYRVFTSTNQEDPSAGGAFILGVLSIFAGLVFLITGVSLWRNRPVPGFRLPERKDLF